MIKVSLKQNVTAVKYDGTNVNEVAELVTELDKIEFKPTGTLIIYEKLSPFSNRVTGITLNKGSYLIKEEGTNCSTYYALSHEKFHDKFVENYNVHVEPLHNGCLACGKILKHNNMIGYCVMCQEDLGLEIVTKLRQLIKEKS